MDQGTSATNKTKKTNKTPEDEVFKDEEKKGTLDKEAPTEGFEEFYKAYPRKVGKSAGQAAYDRALQRTTHAKIMSGLSICRRRWRDPTYIPSAAKWLDDDGYDVVMTAHELGIV